VNDAAVLRTGPLRKASPFIVNSCEVEAKQISSLLGPNCRSDQRPWRLIVRSACRRRSRGSAEFALCCPFPGRPLPSQAGRHTRNAIAVPVFQQGWPPFSYDQGSRLRKRASRERGCSRVLVSVLSVMPPVLPPVFPVEKKPPPRSCTRDKSS